MGEIIITSSILTVIVIAVRTALRSKLSPAVIYALWAVVALRLLLPISLGGTSISAANLIERQSEQAVSVQTMPEPGTDAAVLPELGEEGTVSVIVGETETEGAPGMTIRPSEPEIEIERRQSVPVRTVLIAVWLTGAAVMLAFAAVSNVRTYSRLQKTRRQVDMPWAPVPVYVAEGITSPCLFGVLHPSVYLTEFAAEDEYRARCVIEHELAHYRHRDNIWSLVRVLCLSLYWYNPLVWLAAHLSRQDSELACDSAAVRRLGEENRFNYGRTLIDMMSVRFAPVGMLSTSTAMSSDTRSLRERLTAIRSKPKTLIWAAVIVCVVLAAAVAVTFTGAKSEDPNAILYPDKLTEYTSEYDESNANRTANIEQAAEYIDGYILAPGERFSFNAVVGERTAENGFVIADIHISEQNGEDYGGGINQVATAVFNAALFANLQIDERWAGKYIAPYAPPGEDAYVSWGEKDLQFTNTKEHPVRITVTSHNGVITAAIHGTQDGITAKMDYEELFTTYPDLIYYRPQEGMRDEEGQMGVEVYMSRTGFENDVEVSWDYSSIDFYQPITKAVFTDELPEGYEYDVRYVYVDGKYYPEGYEYAVIVRNRLWFEAEQNGGQPGSNPMGIVLDVNGDGSGTVWFTVGDGGSAFVDFAYDITRDGRLELKQIDRNYIDLPAEWGEISVSLSQEPGNMGSPVDVLFLTLSDGSTIKLFAECGE